MNGTAETLEGRTLSLLQRFVDMNSDGMEGFLGERLDPKTKDYCTVLGNIMLRSDTTLRRDVVGAGVPPYRMP